MRILSGFSPGFSSTTLSTVVPFDFASCPSVSPFLTTTSIVDSCWSRCFARCALDYLVLSFRYPNFCDPAVTVLVIFDPQLGFTAFLPVYT